MPIFMSMHKKTFPCSAPCKTQNRGTSFLSALSVLIDKRFVKLSFCVGQSRFQTSNHNVFDGLWHTAVVGFRYPACNAGEGVAVAAERDAQTQRALEVHTVEECHDGLRHCGLTAFIVSVHRSDFVARAVEIVTERFSDVSPDVLFRLALPCQKYGCCRSLRTFYSLGMVVGYFRRYFGHFERFLQRVECPSHGADAH